MNTRLLLTLGAAALVAAAPAAADLGSQKAEVDSRIASLQDRVDTARAREAALSTQIAATSGRIRALESRVGDVSQQSAALQQELALRRDRLRKLNALFAVQTQQVRSLRRQQALASERLNTRLVDIYEGDDPSTVDVLLSASSFDDLLDKVDYANTLAEQDRKIAAAVAQARRDVTRARRGTLKLRTAAASESRVIAYRARQVELLRSSLVSAAGELASSRDAQRRALAGAQSQEQDWIDEADALRGVSADIGAKIQAAAAPPADTSTGTAPASAPAPGSAPGGFIWPVRGPITSPFGMRWGKLHPGLDIADPTGTPIAASAGGRVVVAGWEGGYGNMVVIDNGGGISTAYAHQSSIAVTVGQSVSQGQTIGYVGSTGFSTGPHLHFEIRVNGSPVDPMGYL